MLRWLLTNGFVWAVRIGSLVAGCLSLQRILATELGYRMDTQVMLTAAVIMIVVVRLWMPWSMQSSAPPRLEDDDLK